MRNEPYGLLNGRGGTDPVYLRYKLVEVFGPSNVVTLDLNLTSADEFDALILLYAYKKKGTGIFNDWGAHYIAAKRNNDGLFTVYNRGPNSPKEASSLWESQWNNKKEYMYFGLVAWGIKYE